MAGQIRGSREWRVTLATKWAYLDNLNAPEIVDRFEEEHGIELAASTVREYLQEEEAEQVREQIKEKHAETRLQIAEREEQLFKRAREAEFQATKDEPRVAVVPKRDRHPADAGPKPYPDWELVAPEDDDYPEWATPDLDVIIRFTDERTEIQPGEEYPLQGLDGEPRYTKEFAGYDRDQPDLDRQRAARGEQTQHLQAKGEVLGVYEETLNIEGEVEASLPEESEEALVGALETLRDREGDV